MEKENRKIKALANLIVNSAPERKELRFGEGENELIVNVSFASSEGVMAQEIKMSVDFLFQDDTTDMNSYMPAFTQFAQRYGILSCYTDIDIPHDLNTAWLIVMYTPIYESVSELLGEKIVGDFVSNFNKLVDARILEIAYATNWNRMLDRIGGILEKLTKNLGDLDIEKTFGMLSGLSKNFDISSLIKSFSGMAEKGGE